MKLINKLWQQKIVRFVCVGGTNTLLDLIMLNSLVLIIGLPVLLANTISVAIGISISFFLNRKFVFKDSDRSAIFKKYVQFFLVTGISVLVIQNTTIYLLGNMLGWKDIGVHALLTHIGLGQISSRVINLNIAKATAVLIGMVWNFMLYNLMIFKKPNTNTHNHMQTDESI